MHNIVHRLFYCLTVSGLLPSALLTLIKPYTTVVLVLLLCLLLDSPASSLHNFSWPLPLIALIHFAQRTSNFVYEISYCFFYTRAHLIDPLERSTLRSPLSTASHRTCLLLRQRYSSSSAWQIQAQNLKSRARIYPRHLLLHQHRMATDAPPQTPTTQSHRRITLTQPRYHMAHIVPLTLIPTPMSFFLL